MQKTKVIENLKDLEYKELLFQENSLKMVASENYASLDVISACSSILSDRYAEGFAGKRFYGGCENVDSIEEQCSKMCAELFGVKYAFLQPNSGSEANLIAYRAIVNEFIVNKYLKDKGIKAINKLSEEEYQEIRELSIKGKALSLSLANGGHLTHGFPRNISSFMFNFSHYGLNDKNEDIDYDALRKQANEIKPLILIAGASAFPKNINFKIMKEIADECGAILMADMAHISGLTAGKVLEDNYNPTKWADIITSSTHKTFRGPRGGMILTNRENIFKSVRLACPLCIGGPHINSILAKGIAIKEASTSEYREYQKQVIKNAKALSDYFCSNGIDVAYKGTETHMVILDLSKYNITGAELELTLGNLGIIVNKNLVPGDKRTPLVTSGIRLGVPALTTRGFKEEDILDTAELITFIIKNFNDLDAAKTQLIKGKVEELTKKHSLRKMYGQLFK